MPNSTFLYTSVDTTKTHLDLIILKQLIPRLTTVHCTATLEDITSLTASYLVNRYQVRPGYMKPLIKRPDI